MKGILNSEGSNNCFLSCVVQVLWANVSFREGFLAVTSHRCQAVSPTKEDDPAPLKRGCVFCSLQKIFQEYSENPASDISVEPLRESLSSLYEAQSIFQLNQKNDATEVYEAVLENLHFSLSSASTSLSLSPTVSSLSTVPTCVPECLVHRELNLSIQEYDAEGKPSLSYSKPVHYVPVLPLVERWNAINESIEAEKFAKKKLSKNDSGSSSSLELETFSPSPSPSPVSTSAPRLMESIGRRSSDIVLQKSKNSAKSFGKILGDVISKDSTGPRPKIKKNVSLLSLGLSWASGRSSQDDLEALLDMLCPVINLKDVFDFEEAKGNSGSLKKRGSENDQKPKSTPLLLQGMICYYGQHYVAFVFNADAHEWNMFDDTMVKSIGPSWLDLITKCKQGHFQPALLFYQKTSKDVAKFELEIFQQLKKQEKKAKRNSKGKMLPTDLSSNSIAQEENDQALAEKMQREMNFPEEGANGDEELAKALQKQLDEEFKAAQPPGKLSFLDSQLRSLFSKSIWEREPTFSSRTF